MRRRLLATAAVLLAVLPLATTAVAAKKPPPKSIFQSKLLWATIDICDTKAHPNAVGIRASMPGSGVAAERMFMRFQLQYLSPADKAWHNIGASGDSGFIALGPATFAARHAGRTFTVQPPSSGAFILRGAVTFEWRKGVTVVRRARKRTRSGHPTTKYADPPKYSAARCSVAKP